MEPNGDFAKRGGVLKISLGMFGALAIAPAIGLAAPPTIIPMKDKGADTFYVDVHVEGFGRVDYLVDTGAGYMTINEDALAVLQAGNNATYVKRLQGILADGRTLIVPVYRVESITIGGSCMIHDVEVAVFPGGSRSLLGLSALRKAAPFSFSVEPPQLQVSNCLEAKPRQDEPQLSDRGRPAPLVPTRVVSAEN